jgi:dTDP-4-amino-4,6-dideoxygalactose transaminase
LSDVPRERGGPGATAHAIPLAAPYVDEREEELVLEVLRSGRLSLGPMLERFEQALAECVQSPFVAGVSSGTAGLHLGVRLLGVGTGDEVVTSPFSFVASANCLLYEGASPVFADVDPSTLNLDPAAVEAAITPRTKAILPVDIFGYPAELSELEAIAARHGLALLEDACQALGAEYRGRPVGSLAHPAVFAFYPNKQLTTGEGGALALASEEEWNLVKSLANQGRSDSGDWLTHSRLGYNYRLDELSAAVGIGQLEKLDRVLALRSAVAERYGELLVGVDGVETLRADDADHGRSWFVYVVLLAPGIGRDDVIARLADDGIPSKPYLPSIHLQPYYRERFGYSDGILPAAEAASARALALPFHTALEPDDQERVVDALRRALG